MKRLLFFMFILTSLLANAQWIYATYHKKQTHSGRSCNKSGKWKDEKNNKIRY